jgi:hypothetical protein
MVRLFELLFAAILIYLAFRRIAAPLQRGYQEREQERRKDRVASTPPKLDRTSVRDAEFKDLA